jgi:hypothetical protein
MPRSTRSPATVLLQEARAIELFAAEVAPTPDHMPDYWDLSLQLIALVADIEEMNGRIQQPNEDDPHLLEMRRRLRTITSALTELDED